MGNFALRRNTQIDEPQTTSEAFESITPATTEVNLDTANINPAEQDSP